MKIKVPQITPEVNAYDLPIRGNTLTSLHFTSSSKLAFLITFIDYECGRRVGMPTYQYECTSCGHQFEQFQSFSEDPIKHCPKCSAEVKKVYSNVGVVFKGSGFYKTDSAPKSSGKAE